MSARIAFLGDTLLGGSAQELLDRHGYDYPLARIRHLWQGTHLVVANHEGPLTMREQPAPKRDTGRKRYWYKGDPAAAHTLRAHGVRVVSLANNHVGDFGVDGVHDTMAAFDSAGIAHCGAGKDAAAARKPVIVQVDGVRLGFISLMQKYAMYLEEDGYARRGRTGPALLRTGRLARDIGALRSRVDMCVVLAHWGRNYRPQTNMQRRLARQLVAAGADLVVGHHPHIPQPVEMVDGIPVLFSLGNAAFGAPGRFRSGRPPYGLVAIAEVEAHRVLSLDLQLIMVDNSIVCYQPHPAVGEDAQMFLSSLRLDPALRQDRTIDAAAAAELPGRR